MEKLYCQIFPIILNNTFLSVKEIKDLIKKSVYA